MTPIPLSTYLWRYRPGNGEPHLTTTPGNRTLCGRDITPVWEDHHGSRTTACAACIRRFTTLEGT